MATLIEGATPKETWDKIAASFGSAFDEIGKGRVRATFERTGQTLEEFSDPYLLVPPKCGYCDYADILAVRGCCDLCQNPPLSLGRSHYLATSA